MESNDFSELPPGRILGIDYGERRTGLAISDPSQVLSSSLSTLKGVDARQMLMRVTAAVRQYDVVAIVVGMPFHMNHTVGSRCIQVRRFIDSLRKICPVPIHTWDERWSTVSAEKTMIERGLSPSRNRDRVDQIAAAFILQSFLDRLNVQRGLNVKPSDPDVRE